MCLTGIFQRQKTERENVDLFSNIAGESQSLLPFLEPSTMALAYSFLPLLPLLCLFCFIM